MRIAIIGGAGKMGRWFANFLLKDGKEVVISGRTEKKLLEAKQQLGGIEVATNVEAVKSAKWFWSRYQSTVLERLSKRFALI